MEQEYRQSVAFVHSMPSFSSRPGLNRIKRLLELLGNPHKKLEFIHIAGTNGKGSVSVLCSSALRQAGYKTGLYISPYVVDFRERFQINGEMISESEFVGLYKHVRRAYDKMLTEGVECNEYDFITALAMLFFSENKCDIVCLEVGLGGEYDATNIIAQPQVSIITKISYDHMAVLGDTIAEIAGEKAGIIKPNALCVSYPEQCDEALAVLMECCAAVGNGIIIPNSLQVDVIRCDSDGSEFIYDGWRYQLRLIGRHQILNCVTAIEALSHLPNFQLSKEQIAKGIFRAEFPGRLEKLHENPLVIVDGAHNSDGLNALYETISLFSCSPKIAVIGMVNDKDWQNAFHKLRGVVDTVIATEPDSPRKLSAELLCERIKVSGIDVIISRDYRKAVTKGMNLAGKAGGLFAFGSLYLVSDIRRMFLP